MTEKKSPRKENDIISPIAGDDPWTVTGVQFTIESFHQHNH